jgi:hypothetical protein
MIFTWLNIKMNQKMKNKLNGIIEMNYLYLIMKETKITTFIEKKV